MKKYSNLFNNFQKISKKNHKLFLNSNNLVTNSIIFQKRYLNIYNGMEVSLKHIEQAKVLLKKFNENSFDVNKVNYPTHLGIDPFHLIDKDLQKMNESIIENVENRHPVLSAMAKYFFKSQGKQFRPVAVLLLSRACSIHNSNLYEISPKHIKLAEIIQMIHTASLVHDDIIDKSDTRRGLESLNSKFGNKLAVLVGDYLLARASVTLAKLENHEVTDLLSNVIAQLVEGEFMQLKSQKSNFDYYLQKTYLKTASLISNSARCAAILSGCTQEIVDKATEYGKNLGIAFQLVDDLLDFTQTSSTLGKPSSVDLKLGLATGPVLFASKTYPELEIMIERKFKNEGDIEFARDCVEKTDAIEKTKLLAADYCNKAILSISDFKNSEAKDSLIHLVNCVLYREK